ncbi:hypothetical protein EUGRSUZ_F01230 [Eucalyptus grandis]|uniref:Uncharacterized protein n=2 Tax=Eucalyptus grandis TaxID=71139 RepID=A0ACC3KDZ6_EUCGR|nr:hypothetical protein EUGRSUZ_F01230 [Eucalyptus grandis]
MMDGICHPYQASSKCYKSETRESISSHIQMKTGDPASHFLSLSQCGFFKQSVELRSRRLCYSLEAQKGQDQVLYSPFLNKQER